MQTSTRKQEQKQHQRLHKGDQVRADADCGPEPAMTAVFLFPVAINLQQKGTRGA